VPSRQPDLDLLENSIGQQLSFGGLNARQLCPLSCHLQLVPLATAAKVCNRDRELIGSNVGKGPEAPALGSISEVSNGLKAEFDVAIILCPNWFAECLSAEDGGNG
jgi:hypothetical protein